MMKAHTFLCAALALCGSAANAQQSVRLGAEVERIENPLLSNVSPGGATVVRLLPSYEYETQSDRIRSRFTLGAVLERSSNTQLLASRDYPSLGYTWGYTWPTASLELRASLAESATRNTELQDFGRVTVDSRERTVLAGAAWTKELTARTRMALGFEDNRVSYDTPLLRGYREQEINSRFSWEASERTSYFIEPAHARLTPSGAGATSTLNRLLVGMTGELAPDWSLTVFGGQARTGSRQKRSDNVGGLRLNYAGSRISSAVEWARDMEPVGTIAGYARTEALRLRVAYQLTDKATVAATASRSRSVGFTSGTGSVISVTLENELAERWSSVLGVEDRRATDVVGATGRGWAVRAGLVYLVSGR